MEQSPAQYKAFDIKTGNTYLIGEFANKADALEYCAKSGIQTIGKMVKRLKNDEYMHALRNRKYE